MALLVAAGAQLMCTMGTTPSPLTLLAGPPHDALAPLPLAVVTDFVPMTNIKSFGMCNSPANPQVAAATAAASGVLTPQPCIPATAAPWAPPSPTVLISGVPAFDQKSTCQCTWTGTITVISPAQVAAVTVP